MYKKCRRLFLLNICSIISIAGCPKTKTNMTGNV